MSDGKATPPPNFSELVTEWERNFNEFSNQVMGTDEYAKAMNQWQGMQLDIQRNFAEAMAKQLAAFNMPSRDDVIMMSEQLRSIDKRLAEIERALEKSDVGFEKPKAKRKAPARTKKPPKKESGE